MTANRSIEFDIFHSLVLGCLLIRHLLATHWALIIAAEPWLDAVWVERVATWQHCGLLAHLKISYAN